MKTIKKIMWCLLTLMVVLTFRSTIYAAGANTAAGDLSFGVKKTVKLVYDEYAYLKLNLNGQEVVKISISGESIGWDLVEYDTEWEDYNTLYNQSCSLYSDGLEVVALYNLEADKQYYLRICTSEEKGETISLLMENAVNEGSLTEGEKKSNTRIKNGVYYYTYIPDTTGFYYYREDAVNDYGYVTSNANIKVAASDYGYEYNTVTPYLIAGKTYTFVSISEKKTNSINALYKCVSKNIEEGKFTENFGEEGGAVVYTANLIKNQWYDVIFDSINSNRGKDRLFVLEYSVDNEQYETIYKLCEEDTEYQSDAEGVQDVFGIDTSESSVGNAKYYIVMGSLGTSINNIELRKNTTPKAIGVGKLEKIQHNNNVVKYYSYTPTSTGEFGFVCLENYGVRVDVFDGKVKYDAKPDGVSIDVSDIVYSTFTLKKGKNYIFRVTLMNYEREDGFTSSIALTNSKGEVEGVQQEQYISTEDEYTTQFDKKINLNAKASTSLSYKSVNTKIAKVDSKGNVTPVAVGKCRIIIKAAETSSFKAAETEVYITITKANQPLKITSGMSKTYKASVLKKKNQTFKIKYSKAVGKVTFTSNKKKNVTVSKNGTVTIKKGTKKGTYKITVKAAGNKNYKAGSKTIVIKVK